MTRAYGCGSASGATARARCMQQQSMPGRLHCPASALSEHLSRESTLSIPLSARVTHALTELLRVPPGSGACRLAEEAEQAYAAYAGSPGLPLQTLYAL
jgi:hypothetical protein